MFFIYHSFIDSLSHSFSDSFDQQWFDVSNIHHPIGKVQRLTADVAQVSLMLAGGALVVVGAAYLEDKIFRLISFNHVTTVRAGFIMLLAPYMLKVVKISLLITAIAMALLVAETALRACVDVVSDWRYSGDF